MTKAFVCFSKERSLHSAEISGKSKFLLFSRRMEISIACCCAAVRLLGAMILFDSGQMTCESFKSSGLDDEELDAVVVVVVADVVGALASSAVTDDFDDVFEMDEDDEDLRVDGFAGTRK